MASSRWPEVDRKRRSDERPPRRYYYLHDDRGAREALRSSEALGRRRRSSQEIRRRSPEEIRRRSPEIRRRSPERREKVERRRMEVVRREGSEEARRPSRYYPSASARDEEVVPRRSPPLAVLPGVEQSRRRPAASSPPGEGPPRSRSRSSHSRRSSSSSSSSSNVSHLYEGFLSDSDDGNDRAIRWMRSFGRKDHIEGRRSNPVITGDTLLEVTRSAIRAKARGKYGTWEDYLRFLHRHSRRCRPPPGRRPEQQTQFLLRNFLRSLHISDRQGDVKKVIDASSFYS